MVFFHLVNISGTWFDVTSIENKPLTKIFDESKNMQLNAKSSSWRGAEDATERRAEGEG